MSGLAVKVSEDSFNTSHVTLYQENLVGKSYSEERFNTSHVTLYPSPSFLNCTEYSCFNTSHVTLYLLRMNFPELRKCVSIHLMLLFIPIVPLPLLFFLLVSIHLMLLFILWIQKTSVLYTQVSIHLMLLFIDDLDEEINSLYVFQYISCYSLSAANKGDGETYISFNTSHVTLYPVSDTQ